MRPRCVRASMDDDSYTEHEHFTVWELELYGARLHERRRREGRPLRWEYDE